MKLLPDAGDYDPARCTLPGCGQPLFLAYHASQDIYASFTEADLTGCRPRDMESWEIRCLDGHVLLLPPDDGNESHLFGTCVCDPDDGHGEGCARSDFARLKAVIDMADNRCTGCLGTGQIRLGGGEGKKVTCPYCHGSGIRRR